MRLMLGLLLAKAEWHFDGFDDWNYAGTVVVLVVIGALLVIGLGSATTSAHRARPKPVPSLSNLLVGADGPNGLSAPKTAFPRPGLSERPRPHGQHERRVWIRREGNPMDIEVADLGLTKLPMPGTVLNRSRGGLLVAVGQPTPKGTILNVRPPNAPDEQMWVQVEVRHCKQKKDKWHLGCKFTKTLPWSVLLLFG
jgi:hypothetical protein